MSNQKDYGKETYQAVIEVNPGTKFFMSIRVKEGIKYPSFSSYGGWDYKTKWGAQGKRFPLTKQGILTLKKSLDDMLEMLEDGTI